MKLANTFLLQTRLRARSAHFLLLLNLLSIQTLVGAAGPAVKVPRCLKVPTWFRAVVDQTQRHIFLAHLDTVNPGGFS